MEQARILVIEDRPADAELLSRDLKRAGFAIALASDGAQGLAAARRDRPDLVICDIGLPRVGGIEVVSALRADSTFDRMPIIVATGLGESDARALARAVGADAVLTKPVNAEALLGEIRRLLDRARAGTDRKEQK